MVKWKRRLIRYILIGLVILLTVDAGLVFGIGYFPRQVKLADGIMVLGAAINTPALYNRTVTGLALYRQQKASVMVLSGGRISEADISEAQYMEKVIKQNSHGQALPAMIIEDQSHNTYENIKNSKALLQAAGRPTNSIIIVSDRFHLARAVLLAYRRGFKQVYWQSPDPTYYHSAELARYYFREMAAMIEYIPKFIKN